MKSAPTPPPPDLMESTRYVAKGGKIFEFKGLTGKILKTKEIRLGRSFPMQPPYSYGVADGALSQRISVNFGSGFQNGKEIRCAGFGGTTPKYESAAGRRPLPSHVRSAEVGILIKWNKGDCLSTIVSCPCKTGRLRFRLWKGLPPASSTPGLAKNARTGHPRF